MTRPRRARPPASVPEDDKPPPDVHVIHPGAVYFRDQFQHLFRLRASTVRREVREGRLRTAKRAGRYFILGEWILEWLRSGEIDSRKARGKAGAPLHNGQN